MYGEDSGAERATKNQYYFYDDGGIKEYGGIKISPKELYTYEGTEGRIKSLEESGMRCRCLL